MDDKDILEEFVQQEVIEDRNYAQILIKIMSLKNHKEARRIIEESGIHIVEEKILQRDWVLLKLNVEDMREISLKLIENGFLNIKGVNALSIKK